ncbi:HD domain-containing protein [Pontibacillus salicampi]|uniref:HD domain-containing protein n=1 Tax=Pontibacillus salicampi TaxID=1449801 RepID=A0ABV6LIM2_9BACI
MRKVTLVDLFKHHITRKYLHRSGIHHAVTAAYYAFDLALQRNVSVDFATKAALLHDIGHYEWYNNNGEWDYDEYRENDIHAIKGAERAHKLLIRLGENRSAAKHIAVAVLLHTDSYLPFPLNGKQTALQEVITLADNKDEQPKGMHHYKQMEISEAIKHLHQLDLKVDAVLAKQESPNEMPG